MAENSWSEQDTGEQFIFLDPLLSAQADDCEPEEASQRGNPKPVWNYSGRRKKAAFLLTAVWAITIALHLVSWGIWVVVALTTLLTVHAMRVLMCQPDELLPPLANEDLVATNPKLPFVSLLVAAKNEEAVIESLVKTLLAMDYPVARYELWVIDDNSDDRTPTILKELAEQYPQLHVLRRGADATGGKSGALNQALTLVKGDIIAVFDADARVPADLFRRVLPIFQQAKVGAVQVRKAISQIELSPDPLGNIWLQGQSSEMLLDGFFQEQRINIGGMGELRGNGQFFRRAALEDCGGWNEETITDDLDLTIRLHLQQWDIEFLHDPPVLEEGVTRGIDLWHQRNRWGEGGYQRYLDYWRPILRNRMGTGKTLDLLAFWVSQYFVAASAIPDFAMALLRNRLPLFMPVSTLTILLSVVGMFVGFRRFQLRQHRLALGGAVDDQALQMTPIQLLGNLWRSVRDTVYMCHWFVVIACISLRISVRPKRLKWVKTIHQGVEGH